MKKINLAMSVLAVGAILLTYGFKQTTTSSNESKSFKVNKTVQAKTNKKPLVNYDYFEKLVKEVKSHRTKRLVNLNTFLTESAKPQKVILDTRSKAMYDLKHVKGAIHLSFSDFTQQALDSIFFSYAGKSTHIYIYCNNNFYDSRAVLLKLQDPAFISKAIIPSQISRLPDLQKTNDKSLALNIPTYINLYGYGYRNVFELNEFVDVNNPKIKFEGTFDDKKN